MEKEVLNKYLNDGLSLNKISKLTGKSLSTITYWKNKYSLKSQYTTIRNKENIKYDRTRFCPKCEKDVLTENFYQRRGKKNSSVYCKICTGLQTLERQRKLKFLMVEYKGGSCVRCGYKKYHGALEFHHLDPNEKDFNPSHLKKYTFDDRVKNELDKCILVCANCHREIHYELNKK